MRSEAPDLWPHSDHSHAFRQGDARYVVKEIPQKFAARIDMYGRIGDMPRIRTPKDSIPERRMLVFDYLDEDLM